MFYVLFFFLTTHDHPFIAIFVDGKSWQHQKIPQGPPEAVHAEWILAPGWAASLHSSHPRRQELADGKHWDSAIFYCFPPIFRVWLNLCWNIFPGKYVDCVNHMICFDPDTLYFKLHWCCFPLVLNLHWCCFHSSLVLNLFFAACRSIVCFIHPFRFGSNPLFSSSLTSHISGQCMV